MQDKKWALVTGGTRGIGRGVVQVFAAAGYRVVFTYLHSTEAAETLQAEVEKAGGQAEGFRCDSADCVAVKALADKLLTAHGAPHAIVNNVGITRDVTFMRMDEPQWKDVLSTNLDSAFFVTRAFIGAMAEKGDGVVLQMSSVSGIKGKVGQTHYSASKAALIGLTQSLALEIARFGLRTNAVLPGFIATEMLDQIPDAQKATLTKNIPLRRLGTVEEVAKLCLYLASDDASYITGQSFVIDGGMTV